MTEVPSTDRSVPDDFTGWVVVTRMGRWLGQVGQMVRMGRVRMWGDGPLVRMSPRSLRKATEREVLRMKEERRAIREQTNASS